MNEENPYKTPEAEVFEVENFAEKGLDSLDRMNRLCGESMRLQIVTYYVMFLTLLLVILGALLFTIMPLVSWVALLGGMTTYSLYTRKLWAKTLAYVFSALLLFLFPFGSVCSVVLILRLRKINPMLLDSNFPSHRQFKLMLEAKQKETIKYLREKHQVGKKWERDNIPKK